MSKLVGDERWPQATALLFGGLWCLGCAHLAGHWNANPQYSFGWLVPPLSGYLLWRRWKTRPQPEASAWRCVRWFVVILAALFFPIWVVAQPSPDWRLVNWLLASDVVALCVCAFAAAGGAAWARHFTFPLALILTAVPWPSGIEQPVVQGLMRLVAAITVEILNLFAVPALQHGNLIEVSSGLLGVDEACSGVRSLQASFMASLFLGDLCRFNLARRIALLLAAVAVAILGNVGRTFVLAWNAARDGMAAIGQWHDPAGVTILTICFLAIWIVALLIGREAREPRQALDILRAHALPRRAVLALAVWFATALVATEAWFRTDSAGAESRWILVPPVISRTLAIEPAARQMLQADRTIAATWTDERARNWVMYFFEWRPGPSRSRLLARLHRPEHCLPAGGWKLGAERPDIAVEKNGLLPLRFRAYTFEQKGRHAFVYFALSQTHSTNHRSAVSFDESTRRASLQAVLWRERRLGQQVGEFVLFGFKNADEADTVFRETVPALVRPVDQPVVPK